MIIAEARSIVVMVMNTKNKTSNDSTQNDGPYSNGSQNNNNSSNYKK